MSPYHIECYIRQTLYGIVPEALWKEHSESGTDPFGAMSAASARKMRRKFRKLKRRTNISSKSSASQVWNRGNRFLKEEMES